MGVGMWLLLVTVCQAQLQFKNYSFEDIPRESYSPVGWFTCGLGSTPDVLPGPWNVVTPPQEGLTYVGLITRENGTKEVLGQRLSQTLKAGGCYTFSVYLARSAHYGGKYNMPVCIRLWAGNSKCSMEKKLATTKIIAHTEWRLYTFQFELKENYNYLFLEANYASGVIIPYNGNVLIDNCSPVLRCARADNHILSGQKGHPFLW
jgi:hypothetical protein